MMDILTPITGIHATIISILAAFFSLFFLFAYQRFNEIKSELDRVLEKSRSFCMSGSYFFNSETELLDGSLNLDWDNKSKNLIVEARNYFSYLNLSEYGINIQNFDVNLDPKELIKTVDELEIFFGLFFRNYPMNGDPFISLSNKSEYIFNTKTLHEITSRVSFLTFQWKLYQKSMIKLFEKYDEINQQFQPKSNSKKLPLLFDFFIRVQEYEDKIIPLLYEKNDELDKYKNTFKIEKMTKYALSLAIFIMSYGIVIPLILIKTRDYYKPFTFNIIEYSLLLITFFPYFFICYWFFNKINKTIFN